MDALSSLEDEERETEGNRRGREEKLGKYRREEIGRWKGSKNREKEEIQEAVSC